MNPSYSAKPPANGLATASLILGIASLLFLCCGASFIFAAPGIVLALLSRGSREMDGLARAGLIFSIIGLVLGLLSVLFILAASFAFSSEGSYATFEIVKNL